MAVLISNTKNIEAKKLARQYKVKLDDLVSITLEPTMIVIEYVEYYKNNEMAFCQKRIHKSSL
jgi:hypothetical protein